MWATRRSLRKRSVQGEGTVGRRGKHPAFDSRDPLHDARADAELDLHGFGAAETPAAVRAFLQTWQRRKSGAIVHIITGKGKGSPGGPVLRGVVAGLLKGAPVSLVADWAPDDAAGGFRVRVR
jgi:DNA-nicking Smr family endonuclease